MAWPKGAKRNPESIEKYVHTVIASIIASHPEQEVFASGIVIWSTVRRAFLSGKQRLTVDVICLRCHETRTLVLENVRKNIHKGIFTGMCFRCQSKLLGPETPGWKGGTRHLYRGYIMIYVPHDHKFASMANSRQEIAEHRLVMAEHLGRVLSSREHIHHINAIKSDNRIQNLELVNSHTHRLLTEMETRIELLENLLRSHGLEVPT